MQEKFYFDCDYMAGAHPEVLQALIDTNLTKRVGYGCDDYTAEAREVIRRVCNAPEAEVYFLVGGTQTNATVIDGVLAHHEGVLTAESGHINVHCTAVPYRSAGLSPMDCGVLEHKDPLYVP